MLRLSGDSSAVAVGLSAKDKEHVLVLVFRSEAEGEGEGFGFVIDEKGTIPDIPATVDAISLLFFFFSSSFLFCAIEKRERLGSNE